MTTTEPATADNGVTVQALLEARDALADAPDAAKFTWRASTEWVRGAHSQTTITDFFGLGADQAHKSTFIHGARDDAIELVGHLVGWLAGASVD